MNNKTIPIFFATDDNYMPYLLITMESITHNASKDYDYIFHILNNGLKKENILLANKYNFENFKVEFVDVKQKITKFGEALHTRDYYSKAIYYRLFIPSLFPNYSKAIYLDCDTIVQGDISKLFNTNLGNNLVGAVADEVVAGASEFKQYTNDFLGVKWNKYFNSGVLVMNLDALREIDFEQKFINIIGSYTFMVAPDQDYLNVICKDKVAYVDLSWNKMPFSNTMPMQNVNLIHYNLTAKPWHYDGILYEEAFWKYAKLTDVYEKVLTEKNNYDKANILKDAQCEVHLKEMAKKQSQQSGTFAELIESGEIDRETYLRKELFDAKVFLKEMVQGIKAKKASKESKRKI